MASNYQTSAYDHLIKLLIIGDAGTRKRALLKKYIGDGDMSDTTTLGLDYKLKDIVYRAKRIKLQLWDTAGQERFRSVTASYYRGAHGALLVFSLKKETSFVSLNYWLEEIQNNAPQRFQVILVATDVGDEDTQVNVDIASQFAREKGLPLFQCDVEDSDQVEHAFSSLVERIMDSWDKIAVGDSVRLDDATRDEDMDKCAC